MMYWLIYDLTTGDVDQAGTGFMVPSAGAGKGSIFTNFALPSTDPAELWVKPGPPPVVQQRLQAPTAPPATLFADKTLAMTALPDTRYIVNGVEKPADALLVNPIAGAHRIILRGLYFGEFVVQVVDRRAMMLAAVKAKRNELRSGIAPTTLGPVDIDIYGRDNITRLLARFDGLLAPLLTTVSFRLANNTERTMTASQFRQMNHEIGVFLNAVQARKNALDAAIKAPGADLSKIDVTAGWPAPGVA